MPPTKTWGEYWAELGRFVKRQLVLALPEFGGVDVEDLAEQGFPAARLAVFYLVTFVACFFALSWVNVNQLLVCSGQQLQPDVQRGASHHVGTF